MPMTTAQLELSFGTRRARLSPPATRRASNRNPRWWFQRMRQIVDRALDWDPVTTKPSKKKLLELGLDDIANELWPPIKA